MVEGGMLSPEEIEALLSSTQAPPEAAPARPAGGARTRGMDVEGRRKVYEKIDRASASGIGAASILLGRTLSLDSKGGVEADPVALAGDPGGRAVAATFSTPEGKGAVLLTLPLAAAFADLMMGRDATAPPAELDDLYLSAVKETLSQFLSASFSALAREGVEIRPQIGDAGIADVGSGDVPLAGDAATHVLRYHATGENLPEGELILLLSASLGAKISGPAPGLSAMPMAATGSTVAAVKFPQLHAKLTEGQTKNIELLLDVPMHITVELGRTTRMIREVLNLGTGSIIELDKLAGEPVDLLVNGKLIAKGEVVVIDESFGVRVTEIVSPIERITGAA